MKVLRFKFKLDNGEKFRTGNGYINHHDKRTAAGKKFIEFSKNIRSQYDVDSCWVEKLTETSLILAIQIR